MGRKCVNDENLREIRRDNVNCENCTCNDLEVMCNLLCECFNYCIVVNCEWKC